MSRLISIAQASEMLGVSTRKQADSENLQRQKEKLENNEEMVNDLISVVTCFSARLYGTRGYRKLKKVIAELEIERGVNSEGNNEGTSY